MSVSRPWPPRCMKLGLASDPGAKGPIVAISSTNAMIVALGAWFMLRERLSKGQLLGMLVIICGIVVMALGAGAGSSRVVCVIPMVGPPFQRS